MKTAVIPRGMAGLFLLLSTGCGTLEFPPQRSSSSKTIPAPSGAVVPSDALAQYSMGIIEEINGNPNEALDRFQKAIAADPGNLDLKIELAAAYLHRGRHDEVDRLVGEVLQQQPDFIRAYQLQTLNLRLQGKYREALVPLNAAIGLAPDEAIHQLERASIYVRLGELSTAIESLEHALATTNDRLEIFHGLGDLYLRQAGEQTNKRKTAKLPDGPLELMRWASEEFPEDARLLNQYGDLLILHQKIEEAIDVFAKIEQLDPEDLRVRQKLAMSLIATGNRTRAIELLQEVAEKRPNNDRLWYYLAELHQQDGDIEKASESYERAIAANPAAPESYIKAAYLHITQEKNDDALRVLAQGLERNPGDMRIVEMMAYVYMTQSRYDLAIEQFAQAEKFIKETNGAPVLSNFYINYAISSQMVGEYDEAARLLRDGLSGNPHIMEDYLAISLRSRTDQDRMMSTLAIVDSVSDLIPDDPDLYTLYGLIAFNAEAYTEALPLFERAESIAFEEDADDQLTAQFYFWMGACAERIKEYDKSEKYFLQAITLQPDHADAHNYLAYMLAERGVKLEMAYDHVGVALAIEPDNGAYLDTRGWIYYQQGRYQEALVDILAAAERVPDDATISDHLGDIYLALGDESNAIAWWKKSLEADATNDTVREKLKSTAANPEPDAPKPEAVQTEE